MKKPSKKKLLNEAIVQAHEDVNKLPAGSEPHSRAINDVTNLRESERKDKELRIKTTVDVCKTIGYGLGFVGLTLAGFFFEEHGNINSFSFKNVLNCFKPKNK